MKHADLAIYLCYLEEDAVDDRIEKAIFEKYHMEMDEFDGLIDRLLNLVDVAKSTSTGVIYKGFSKQDLENDRVKIWLSKIEYFTELPDEVKTGVEDAASGKRA